MSVFFISDTHLGSESTADKRGFSSVEEHDACIINDIMSVAHKKAIIWILGDVAMSKEALFKLKNVECRMKVVLGNHDEMPVTDYMEVFESVHGAVKYKKMWITHFPVHPQEMLLNMGEKSIKANIHGHIHKNAITDSLHLPYINVNWDFIKTPVSLDQIKNTAALYTDMCQAEAYARVYDMAGLQHGRIKIKDKDGSLVDTSSVTITKLVPNIRPIEPDRFPLNKLFPDNSMIQDDATVL